MSKCQVLYYLLLKTIRRRNFLHELTTNIKAGTRDQLHRTVLVKHYALFDSRQITTYMTSIFGTLLVFFDEIIKSQKFFPFSIVSEIYL